MLTILLGLLGLKFYVKLNLKITKVHKQNHQKHFQFVYWIFFTSDMKLRPIHKYRDICEYFAGSAHVIMARGVEGIKHQ